jgi:phosphoserine phosphatase RsbU/P
MTTADFFDTRTRNWRARLAISVDLMRELSGYSDPRDLFEVFSRRMGQLFPTARQLTLSRRGVEQPDVRITRFNLWSGSSTNSTSIPTTLPSTISKGNSRCSRFRSMKGAWPRRLSC